MNFQDLKIGQTFDFISPTIYNSFYERCRKIGARTYTALVDDGKTNMRYGIMRVGSVKAKVYHVAGEMEAGQ